MRILFALHQFFPEHQAGTEVVTLGLARQLRARGHEPFVLAPKRSIPFSELAPGEIEDYEVEGIPVRRIGRQTESSTRTYHLGYRSDVMAARARDWVRETGPDVVHAMHFQALTTSVVPVFHEFGLPVVYTATDFWAICPVVDMRRHDESVCAGPELAHCIRCVAKGNISAPAAALLSRAPDALIGGAVRAAGTPLSRHSASLRQVQDVARRRAHVQAGIDRVDHVTVPSNFMRDMLTAHGVGRGEIEVSRHGIDTSRIERRAPDAAPPSPVRIGLIGTLAEHKGCDILIRAFRKLPAHLDATLTIHGNLKRFPPYVRELRALASNDARITFAGTFPRERIGRTLGAIDVLVVPSRWYENSPLVIFEAFAAGVPVVATDLGGMAEAVASEGDGLLFELEDVDDLARQLRRLIEEPGLIARLRAGIGPVKTVEEDAAQLERLYERLIRQRRGTVPEPAGR